MPPERFSVLKISFMEKNVGTSYRMEDCKKHFQKKICQENLRSKSFGLDLWY